MNWSRLTPWLIGAAAAVLLAGTLGYVLGTGSSTSSSEAESARQDSYDTAYENAFAKFKVLPHKAAERTVASLWRTIGCIVDAFSPTECANYFAAAGYDADLSDFALAEAGKLFRQTEPSLPQ